MSDKPTPYTEIEDAILRDHAARVIADPQSHPSHVEAATHRLSLDPFVEADLIARASQLSGATRDALVRDLEAAEAAARSRRK